MDIESGACVISALNRIKYRESVWEFEACSNTIAAAYTFNVFIA